MKVLNSHVRSATDILRAAPAAISLALCFAILSVCGMWPALTNGQPFFFPDTTAYVRGADLAIAKVFGDRFATDWAKDPRRALEAATNEPTVPPASANQTPVQRPVLAGRSVFYGLLLYLGALTGRMWFSISVQSLIAVYLIYLFTTRTLGLNLAGFLVSCAVLFLATSLPFYVSLLMPDVFAGFLILAFSILATTWGRLRKPERAITSFVLLFAVLSHTTHMLLLAVLTALAAAYLCLGRVKWARVRPLLALGTVCVVVTIVWEGGFAFAVKNTLGAPLVRPPFLTAKLVSMLGERAVARTCESHDFVVCKFQDRFPLDSDSFLWSEDKHSGVFSTVDLQTKQALGAEQLRFAIAIILPNFGRFTSGVFRDGLRQLTSVGLDEYSYANAMLFFKDRLPSQDFATMTSTVAAGSRVYVAFGKAISYVTAALGVLLIAALLRSSFTWKETLQTVGAENTWQAAVWIQLAGVVFNAFVCGGLSSVNDRYEARVIWLLPLALVTGLLVMRRVAVRSAVISPALEKNAEFLHS